MDLVIEKSQSVEPVPRRPATESQRKALASALRLRILRLCLHQERTNRQIADALGRDPGTVLHHVRTLVDTGFLAAGEPRRGNRGAREIPYRATGLSWHLDLESASDTSGWAAMLEATEAELAGAPVSDVTLARLGLQLSNADANDLRQRVMQIIEEFAARPADPDGKPWAVTVAVYPDGGR